MKKLIIGIILLIIIAGLGVGSYYLFGNKNNDNVVDNDTGNNEVGNQSENTTTPKKILVVYYSAQNHTREVAKKIASNLDADIFEIVPKKEYTSNDLNWNDKNSRVSKEHDDESLRNVELVSTTVDNFDKYDTVLIGYPIWWGIAAWPVDTFVKNNNFTGKTVIPFCTSASSSLGNSGKLLENIAGTGKWQDGHRFSSNASDKDIKSFTDSINKN